MSSVAPESIRKLIACNPSAVERTAKSLSIPKVQAARLRDQWTRRITGRCVYCGKLCKQASCKSCGHVEPEDRRTTAELLNSLELDATLIRKRCLLCQQSFSLTVRSVLRIFELHGEFRIPHVCNGCKKKRRFNNKPFAALKGQIAQN